MDYIRVDLQSLFSVNKIITLFYFELSRTYFTRGEAHDFWELVYVDKGEVTVVGDDKSYLLTTGQVIFHKPNEFHIVRANGIVAPNIVIVTFECNNDEMKYFFNRVFSLGDAEKKYIADIVKVGLTAFEWFHTPAGGFLKRTAKCMPGDEQFLKINLELLLLQLFRRGKVTDKGANLTQMPNLHYYEGISNSITAYLKQNLSRQLTLEKISQHFGMGISNLKKVYHSQTGTSIISSLISLRIEEVKRLIRESSLSFTQIAETAGFSSIHHMSAVFKRKTGMTPSEYSLSIKSYNNE